MVMRAVFLPFAHAGGRVVLSISIAAWILLLLIDCVPSFGGRIIALCTSRSILPALDNVQNPPLSPLLTWALMVLAMAPLLLRDEIARLCERNFPRHRRNAVFAFLAGYACPWLILFPLHDFIREHANDGLLTLVLISVTSIWLCSPVRQGLINACHIRPILPVAGVEMMTHTCLYGVRVGAYCSAICGPLMIIASLAESGHTLFMAVFGVPLVVERYLPSRPVRWQLPIHPIGRSPHPAVTPNVFQR